MRNIKVGDALGFLATRKLISVDAKTPLRDVLRTLHSNRILSVPVMVGDKGCVGLVDVLDLVRFTAMQFFKSQEASVMDDNVQIAPELFREFEFGDNTAGDLVQQSERSRAFRVLDRDATLGELAHVLRHDSHRVLIGRDAGSARMVSQSDMVRYISERKDQLDPKTLGTPLNQLNILHKQVVHVNERTSTIKALCRIVRHQVGALAVLDDKQRVVGTVSASDLRGLTEDKLVDLARPVNEFLQSVERKGPQVQRGDDNLPSTSALVRCSPHDKLDLALNKLVQNRVHRLWVTDDTNGKALSLVSLTDILHALL